jgi:hypothetical protein
MAAAVAAAEAEDLEEALGREMDECPFDDVVPAAMREADGDHDGRLNRADFESLIALKPGDLLQFYESRRVARPAPGAATIDAGGEPRSEAEGP